MYANAQFRDAPSHLEGETPQVSRSELFIRIISDGEQFGLEGGPIRGEAEELIVGVDVEVVDVKIDAAFGRFALLEAALLTCNERTTVAK